MLILLKINFPIPQNSFVKYDISYTDGLGLNKAIHFSLGRLYECNFLPPTSILYALSALCIRFTTAS